MADGGRRTCLSVNNGEPVRPGSNADLAGYRTVADITRKILDRIEKDPAASAIASAGC